MSKAIEAIDEWLALYETVPPMIEESEKSVNMIARELNMDVHTAKAYVDAWLAEGKIVEVGMRRTKQARPTMCYRLKEAK